MSAELGRKLWFFADGELPPPGVGHLVGHESLVVLNPNSTDAMVRVCLYWADRDPDVFSVNVPSRRVRCVRTNDPEQMGGIVVPPEVQYAISLTSNVGIVVQYGRLDVRQANMAFYPSTGFSQ